MAIVLDIGISPGVVVALDVSDDDAHDIATRYARTHERAKGEIIIVHRKVAKPADRQ